MMKNLIVLLISTSLICLIISCTGSKENHKADYKESIPLTINNQELHTVLDSFSKLNLKYAHCIPTVGYLKIVESKRNNELKILIESYEINSPNLKNLTFDQEFRINNFRFFLNQNNDSFFGKNGSVLNVAQVMKKEVSKNSKKRGCGSQYSWLVHFSNESIDSISYNATNQFEIPCMKCDEWGDLSRTFIKINDSLKRI